VQLQQVLGFSSSSSALRPASAASAEITAVAAPGEFVSRLFASYNWICCFLLFVVISVSCDSFSFQYLSLRQSGIYGDLPSWNGQSRV